MSERQNRGKPPVLLWWQCHWSATLLLLPHLSKHTNEGTNSMHLSPKPPKIISTYLRANEWFLVLHFWHYLMPFPSSKCFPNSLYPTAVVWNCKFTHAHGIFSLWLKMWKVLKNKVKSVFSVPMILHIPCQNGIVCSPIKAGFFHCLQKWLLRGKRFIYPEYLKKCSDESV